MNTKLVLFLGAGFSAPFGHPVMSGFRSAAEDSGTLSRDELSFLSELWERARNANAFLASSQFNLEDILSFFVMKERLDDAGEREDADRLKLILAKVYTHTRNTRGYWRAYDVLRKFLGPAAEGKAVDISVITTNYDLNAESAFYRLGMPLSLGFPAEAVERQAGIVTGNLYGAGGPLLYKLHGSVNWYLDSASGSVGVEGRIVSVFDHHGADMPELPWPCAGDYHRDFEQGVPLIVAPSFLKPALDGPLPKAWRGASQAISEARHLVFIGYSFPPTDVEMRYFLAHSLGRNAGLRSISIVDTRANDIVARLRAPGSWAGAHFQELLRPIEGDWTRSKLIL
ncbi:MAG: SIR2 family protein [Planctomycetes bacterium]|nr:SIR2 family protein [Planctomycetota bacterium]